MRPLPARRSPRRHWLRLALLGSLLALACPPGDTSDSPPTRAIEEANSPIGKPNVVLYLIDTLRADRIGTYGYPRPTTPAIDELAAHGIVFEDAYSPGPWTLPSVASIMLSQPLCRHGVVIDGKKISRDARPLATVLRKSGYRTASFVANSYAGHISGLHRGFDHYEGPVFAPARRLDAFLDLDPEQPFFAYIHDTRPHDPFEATHESIRIFGEVSKPELQEIKKASHHYRKLTRIDHAAGSKPGSTDNTEAQRGALARLDSIANQYGHAYDARVREADEEVRNTLEVLRRRKILKDTIFVLLSDHGEEMGEHGGWMHDQSVYEELIRSPLIFRLPGGKSAPRRITEPVSLLDVAPTILDLTRTSVPDGFFEGRSLVPLWEGPPASLPKPLPRVVSMRRNEKKFYRPWKEGRGDQNLVVRDGDWKAIWNTEPDSLELYDLGTDPTEKTDLSRTQPQRAARMHDYAREYLARCQERRDQPIEGALPSGDAAARLRALGYID